MLSRENSLPAAKTVRILGLDFFNDRLEKAIQLSLSSGLVLAPSGPGLATVDTQAEYAAALASADLLLIDSGYLALCWRLLRGEKLQRISGLRYLEALLACPDFIHSPSQLWVMPDAVQGKNIRQYLRRCDLKLSEENIYIAPLYSTENLKDPQLLERIQTQKPRFVVLNIAGGKQEIIAAWLKSQLSYPTTLICTGAAIAFMSGAQVRIPRWADRCFLGWLLRILKNPQRYTERYLKAFKLFTLIQRYGAEKPLSTNANKD